jgi:hypothetical protein
MVGSTRSTLSVQTVPGFAEGSGPRTVNGAPVCESAG